MKEKITEIFSTTDTLTFNEIKKKLGISRAHKDNELKETLEKLELVGFIYQDEKGIYKKFPANFFIAQVETSSKGKPYIIKNKQRIILNPKNLDGVLNYDTVMFKRSGKEYQVVKVLKRKLSQVICEVKVDENNTKYLQVCNTKNKVYIRIDSKNMKKLVEGERILVDITTERYDNFYEGTFLKRIGHKNDFDTELKTIAYNNGFITDYNNEILEEIEKIPDEINENDIKNRIDKRKDLVFTIDGKNTKDIDDAVELRTLPNGNYLLIVSIAHVSHYVKPGSALWSFAEKNTTSLYFANFVLAMLHAKLSNGICSLNPNVDRLARSFEMEINPYGDVINFKTYKSVIHSVKKMTYEEVNEILINNNIPEGYEPYVENLKLMHQLSKILSIKKYNNGAIDFANKEVHFKVDDDGNIEKSILSQGPAEKIVENFMITTNVSVGKHFSELLLPFVYRNHEFPITDKIKEIYYLLKKLGYRLEKINFTDDSQTLQKIIRSLANKEEFVVLSILILQSMQRAYYSKDNHGHFGLAEDYYSQSTSPIRRFLDLIIHTLIDYYEDYENNLENINKIEKYLEEACTNATIKERCADKAEYEADKLYMVNYMKDKIGEEYYGFISNINENGISIKTSELIDGYCYFNFHDYGFVYYPESKFIINKEEKLELHIGSKIKVKLCEVDLTEREIKFDIIEPLNITKNLTRERKK